MRIGEGRFFHRRVGHAAGRAKQWVEDEIDEGVGVIRIGPGSRQLVAIGGDQRRFPPIVAEIDIEIGRAEPARFVIAVDRGAIERGRHERRERRRAEGHRHRVGVERHRAGLDHAAEILIVVGGCARHRPERESKAAGAERRAAKTGAAIVLICALQKQRGRAVVLLFVGDPGAPAHAVGRFGIERHRDIGALLLPDLAAGQRVAILPAIFVIPAIDPRREPLHDRDIDAARHHVFVIFGRARAEDAAEFVARRLGDEIDRARIGVAAVERGLRTLDDLDPLERVEIEALHVAAEQCAIDEDRNARFDPELHAREHVAEAADDRAVGIAPEGLAERQAGRLRADIGNVGKPAILQRLARKGGDRDRRIVDRFLGLARGDDDHRNTVRRLLGTLRFAVVLGQRGPRGHYTGRQQARLEQARHRFCPPTPGSKRRPPQWSKSYVRTNLSRQIFLPRPRRTCCCIMATVSHCRERR